jgi:hypothetical protein
MDLPGCCIVELSIQRPRLPHHDGTKCSQGHANAAAGPQPQGGTATTTIAHTGTFAHCTLGMVLGIEWTHGTKNQQNVVGEFDVSTAAGGKQSRAVQSNVNGVCVCLRTERHTLITGHSHRVSTGKPQGNALFCYYNRWKEFVLGCLSVRQFWDSYYDFLDRTADATL